MIRSAMNKFYFKKNVGKKFKFFPIPTRNSASGPYESDKNLWLLYREAADQNGYEFHNLLGDYNTLVLDQAKIKNYDEPDLLSLRGQVIFEGSTVRYEPFIPQPAALSIPNTSLSMFLEGAGEDGIAVFTTPSFDSFHFCVKNTGEQTVRDYRNTILIPQAFRWPSSPFAFKNLSKQDDIAIGDQQYVICGNLLQTPIYKNEQIRIGSLILQADPGDYTILWKIRCDDGVFPSEDTYGQILIRLVSIVSVLENIHKQP